MKILRALSLFMVVALALQARAESHESLEDEEVDCLFQKPDCFCLEYEEPVCATNGCTYTNPCRLSCADAELAYEGVCQEHEEPY